MLQVADRNRRSVGEDISLSSPASSCEAAFVGFSSTGDSPDVISGVYVRQLGYLLLFESDDFEDRVFRALAEASFAEDWDSEADSIYNDI